MADFNSNHPVTIVRGRGTPDEQTWETLIGGDLARKALFKPNDRIKTGDEIHSDVFDEPKIIARVDPGLSSSGVSYWLPK